MTWTFRRCFCAYYVRGFAELQRAAIWIQWQKEAECQAPLTAASGAGPTCQAQVSPATASNSGGPTCTVSSLDSLDSSRWHLRIPIVDEPEPGPESDLEQTVDEGSRDVGEGAGAHTHPIIDNDNS